MSTMRNAAPRRPHKERSQPQARSKHGLLEKHKDYSLRAADYNLKKKKLAVLSQKVSERNPDEFAFGMMSGATAKQGKHGAAGDTNRLSHDAVKLLKTQDAGYLRVTAGRGRRELEKVKEEIALEAAMRAGGVASERKIVFADTEPEIPRGKKRHSNGEILLELPTASDTPNTPENDKSMEDDEPTTNTQPKSRRALETERKGVLKLRLERKRRKRIAEARVNKLEALKKRQREILAVADRLEEQRAKMARSIGGVNKNGVKFRIRERKK